MARHSWRYTLKYQHGSSAGFFARPGGHTGSECKQSDLAHLPQIQKGDKNVNE